MDDMNRSQSAMRRSARGNTYLIIVTVCCILAVIWAGLFFFSAFFTQQRVETQAEKMALSVARLMNRNDRVGQINNMLAASRQLVFNDRENYQDVVSDYPALQPFAKRLLDESKSSAGIMIEARQTLGAQIKHDIVDFTVKSIGATSDSSQYALPGISEMGAGGPKIVDLEVGSLQGGTANVESAEGDIELTDYDLSQKLVATSSHLYLGNISATLPDPDSDLVYKIATLPAPVLGTIAPARLILNQVFQNEAKLIRNGEVSAVQLDQLPSAVKLGMVIDFKGVSGKIDQHMVVTGIAVTNGGYPRP
jgi:hypothetical protein